MTESDLLNEDFLDGKGGLRKDVQHDFEVVCADSNCSEWTTVTVAAARRPSSFPIKFCPMCGCSAVSQEKPTNGDDYDEDEESEFWSECEECGKYCSVVT